MFGLADDLGLDPNHTLSTLNFFKYLDDELNAYLKYYNKDEKVEEFKIWASGTLEVFMPVNGKYRQVEISTEDLPEGQRISVFKWDIWMNIDWGEAQVIRGHLGLKAHATTDSAGLVNRRSIRPMDARYTMPALERG